MARERKGESVCVCVCVWLCAVCTRSMHVEKNSLWAIIENTLNGGDLMEININAVIVSSRRWCKVCVCVCVCDTEGDCP